MVNAGIGQSVSIIEFEILNVDQTDPRLSGVKWNQISFRAKLLILNKHFVYLPFG